ncbi:hypothetical protein [Streptomyces fodineus]|uniref:hypothetical protein n=1 Tax=Streptomyces fodineus TaxID=1904616 RepID=UPI00131E94D4|nr:hypothetical protein [Streptomyces fodineus]
MPIFEAGVNWIEKQAKVSTKNDLLVSSRAIRPISSAKPVRHRGVIYLEKAQEAFVAAEGGGEVEEGQVVAGVSLASG